MAVVVSGRTSQALRTPKGLIYSSKHTKSVNPYQNHSGIRIMLNVLIKISDRKDYCTCAMFIMWLLCIIWIARTVEWLLINFTIKIKM